MKTRISYLFLLLAFAMQAQEITLPVSNTGRQKFAGNLIIYGLQQKEKSITVNLYRLNGKSKIDSLIIDVKGRAEDHLNLYSDTLHGFLNVYVQKIKSRVVKVIRVHRNFSLHAELDEVDIARLNSISFFEKEIAYSGKHVFTINSTPNDSLSRQFYLNKFTLKSDKENFEYTANWQFPFDKKFIHSAQIVSADKKHVYLIVNINKDVKKGQWYLKLDALEGKLVKAQKLNNNGDTSVYATHLVKIDSATKSHFIFGQRFSAEEYDPAANTFKLTGKKTANFYLAILDSLMEILSKNEFKVPVSDVLSQSNKVPSAFLAKATTLNYGVNTGFKIELDVFKSLKSRGNCFRYSNNVEMVITEKEGSLQLQKTSIGPNLNIDQYFSDADAADFSGLLCLDSLNNPLELLFKPVKESSKLSVKKNEVGQTIWLLQKNNLKKNLVNLSILAPEKKIYKLRTLSEMEKPAEPFVEIISANEIIIGKKKDGDKLSVQFLTW